MDEMHEKLGKLKIDLAAMGSVAISCSAEASVPGETALENNPTVSAEGFFLIDVNEITETEIRIPEASVEAMVSVFQNWAGPKGEHLC